MMQRYCDFCYYLIFKVLFFYLLDVYKQGFWGREEVFQDQLLKDLSKKLPEVVVQNKAYSTAYGYSKAFLRWKKFALSRKDKISVLPAQPNHVALYLVYLIQTSNSPSPIFSAFHGIAWAHEQAGIISPTQDIMVKNVYESATRILAKKTEKKKPFKLDHLQKAMVVYDDNQLMNLRFLAFMLLSFAGFFRSQEVLKLKVGDINFENDYISIFLEFSKTDQYRDGSWVLIAKTSKITCPYTVLKRYMCKADLFKELETPLFRNICKTNKGFKVKKQPLTYSRIREIIKEKMEPIVGDIKNYSVHSLRSGGATAAANAGVKDRLFKRHGRWLSERAKDGYIEDDLKERLLVSQSLGL